MQGSVRYQYVRERAELTDALLEWLYEHCGECFYPGIL